MIFITVLTLIIGVIGWYIGLFALNIYSIEFWVFLFVLSKLFEFLVSTYDEVNNKKTNIYIKAIPIIIVIVLLGGSIVSDSIFNAKKYSKMLEVKEGNFTEDISEIPLDNIPVVDRVTAIKLGDRKMGEMVELASQFNVSDAYTQIDFQDRPVRVTPLEYNGFFKWLNNKSEGIPGYITVDMSTGETTLHKLEENIRYSKSDKFSRDIKRHLRKQYPTKLFYEISFEIDEEGHPYWIAPTYKRNIGLFGGTDVDEVLVVDAVTGETNKYGLEDVPTWIDRVYDADRIIRQIDDWGSLKNGFINSMFTQKEVLLSTEGYNYLAIEDDVFLYTGITSASEDSSNVGFMLTNLRTKETKFYRISSADEYSAMESAEGEIQEKEYNSTFPILLNIDNKPTYMMALKDNAGLIKAYALVDAENYQKVSVGSSIEKALEKHLGDRNLKAKEVMETIVITIEDIKSVVINGFTEYYIKSENINYIASVKINTELPFITTGTTVEINFYIDKEGNNRIDNLEVK